MLLVLIIALPFAGSALAALVRSNNRNTEAWLAGSIAVAEIVLLSVLRPAVMGGGVLRAELAWLPSAGLDFVVRLDGFAWLFAMLVAGIGLLVVVYARYYMSPADPIPRFFSFFLAFMGAMLGIVVSGNLIQLVFFWELTSLLSFLLIGFWHQRADAREGARVALTVTAAGGLCLFAGILLIGHIAGSYDLDQVLASGSVIRSSPLYLPALVLVLLGALTKSAQFPFHFWLPRAMAAPTPVSAYLHSATMVKAGVFLLVRLWPVLAGTDYWLWFVGTTGLITFVFGAYYAMFQQDLKGLLAYSTVSHLGLITLLLGLDSPLALLAAIFHIVNHATFKASLFMAAGIIDHETGTRDLRRLSGLYRFMPITATLAMVAAAAMAGVPLLNGFLSKEMFFAETIATHDGSFVDAALPYVATLAGIFGVVYSLRFILGVFFGPAPRDLPRPPHEPPRWMRFPIEALVLICVVVGVIPAMTIKPFLTTAARSILGEATPSYSLGIWHGFTLPLLMSAVAIAGGVAFYFLGRRRLAVAPDGPPVIRLFAKQRIFERAIVMLSWRWAKTLEEAFGTNRLQPQMRLLICTAFLAAFFPVYVQGAWPGSLGPSPIDPAFALVWAGGVVCAIGAAYQAKYHRLAALILMGGAGLATCITFVLLAAPDLALTQLVVEAVTTVLIVLGLRWLPKRLEAIPGDFSNAARLRRMRDLVIAVAAGGGLALLAYAMMTRPYPAGGIAGYFLQHAYAEGGGTNVVNVILVDFRGFDTLGEITVLGIVALSVFALLRRFRPASDNLEGPEQQHFQDIYDRAHPDRHEGSTLTDYLAVPAVLMKLLFPIIGIAGIYLFLRGHDQPGGGFVAGLTMAVAILVQYMAGGARWVEARLRVHPLRWMGFGLLFAVSAGVIALFSGQSFLTALPAYVTLPWLGTLPLGTVLLFDFGVLALVLGATVLMLIALAHQSLRRIKNPAKAPAHETEVA